MWISLSLSFSPFGIQSQRSIQHGLSTAKGCHNTPQLKYLSTSNLLIIAKHSFQKEATSNTHELFLQRPISIDFRPIFYKFLTRFDIFRPNFDSTNFDQISIRPISNNFRQIAHKSRPHLDKCRHFISDFE